jgi:hypothetical protein
MGLSNLKPGEMANCVPAVFFAILVKALLKVLSSAFILVSVPLLWPTTVVMGWVNVWEEVAIGSARLGLAVRNGALAVVTNAATVGFNL